ncbi:GON-4-like protein [Ooceraea biroi]|uniref:GON-4-like protein n=1 Tax=Ooceraea biroi TaxID=2015173 RepID=A0A026VZ73_OOCBI|nr:GON-4-like protein [Ooceraea biroi]
MDNFTDKCVENGALASSVSLSESPKKCNLSFSINFDFNDVNNENSTDSENADLQIDISEVDNYEPSSKHRREAVDEASVLNEMEEEIERQLDAKAAKTNLTATNVKNILKHVIPYENLMTMIQTWLQDAQNDVNFGLKLTRAKAKKLGAAQVNIPWPITTAQKASSEVQALIQEELPEDSSDEEYNPEHDKHSDDDREAENAANGDVESLTTILTNDEDVGSSKQQASSQIQYDPEGIFKIPAVPHVSTEEESIGQRTRSKFSLSETSLEEIEQAFIPPDITADMTEDWDFELDEDWDNFLKEFTRPLRQEPAIEDDPEADPEYNILEDEETDLLDKEELRTDKAVEVPRKEQFDLIAELLELTPMFLTQEQEISRKKRPPDNTTPPTENNTMNCSMADLLPVAEPELPKVINPEQRLLLKIQLQQHVQLMAQHFVMTYMHPEHHELSKMCKQNLNNLRYMSKGPNSAFNADNLEEAFKLASTWESKFSDSNFHLNYQNIVTDEIAKGKMCRVNKWGHVEAFIPELEELFIESKALMYPQLLPQMPFKSGVQKHVKSVYSRSEENLIALGIEQFLPFVASRTNKFKTKKIQLFDAGQLICKYLLPCRDAKGLLYHIQKRRVAKDNNPIKHYFEKGYAPRTIHYITLESKLKAPKEQPIELLSLRWQMYLNMYNQRKHRNKSASIHLFLQYSHSLRKQDSYMNATRKPYPNVPNNHPLRNPIVNMLPKILPATMKPKGATTDKISNAAKATVKFNDGNSSERLVDDEGEMTEGHVEKNKSHSNVLNSPKASAADIKTLQTDKVPDKNNVKLNSVVATSSMVPKTSSQKSTGLPQIRRTTPRLAKTRSAQNMKLMAQALGSKTSSSCNSLKSKEKNTDKATGEHSTASKVDNEEEIAELMLACTTITKDSVSRKKAKQTRELEIIKRLLKAENPLTEEERKAKFAASYLQKLHVTLESSNPEIFKAVMKLFLDYNEKLEGMNQAIADTSFSEEFLMDKEPQDTSVKKDLLTVGLYEDVRKRLQNYPEMCTDLLLFLKPHQAAMIGKSVEYIMLQKMNDFVHVAQIYFAKQPSRIAKMMQAITQLSSDPRTTLENVYAVMTPVFKGHPLIMDLFLQILPTAKSPESLFASHMFENLTCPLGPYDKNVTYTENAPELYENIELPIIAYQEDPYGGDNCKCDCHNMDDPNLKNNSDHCVSCGTRFLNGRIYLQTPEGLRPAKITFPGEDQEKLENIARVSLKIADKVVPTPISPKKRRKSTKNDPSPEDICQKQCNTKYSPVKDNEDNEKSKSKGGVKFALKTDKRKVLKRIATEDNVVVETKKMRMSQCKNKREKKAEENDALLENKEVDIIKQEKMTEVTETESNNSVQLLAQDDPSSTEVIVEHG